MTVTGEGSNWWGQSVSECVMMNYVHTDRLGSVVGLSDKFGRVTARVDYDDWGRVTAYTDITVDGGFRRLMPEITYATHEYDDVLGMYYAKARMYDPDGRRFVAVDPILEPGGYDLRGYVWEPMMLVQYLYVQDRPLVYMDPLGTDIAAFITENWVVSGAPLILADGPLPIGDIIYLIGLGLQVLDVCDINLMATQYSPGFVLEADEDPAEPVENTVDTKAKKAMPILRIF